MRLLPFASDVPAPTRRTIIARATPPAQATARVLRTVAGRFTAPDLHRAQLGAVRRG
ncbi:hypothetical protein SUDANB108_06844 [Streptomyces sp. enrichment culture]|uniref:hypothetical protein n=1 Tax=Streptomyces sp. enrichment culture TaxID=1795815 RepID=UPI003F56CE59